MAWNKETGVYDRIIKDYLIPKQRVLDTMRNTKQFTSKNIKDVLFAESESILWKDEIAKVETIHDTAETHSTRSECLFDLSADGTQGVIG
jgi:hypothetical protein